MSARRVPLAVAALALLAGCGDGDVAARRTALGANPTLAARLAAADADRGARLFGQCAACHTIGAGAGDRNGPNLRGVMGAPVAGVSPRFGYTAALRARGGRWTAAAMDNWLADPAAVAPGTAMRFAGVRDSLDRADLIAYLRRQSAATR
ncbi:c-type cytochrome [Sphingomonas sp. BK580]|uniref:c-type cytochrome n=1 Tax=Sphingomonas sp. BK580 TaxID=2586972 RepID=UPI00161FC140|nr:c-type cytochrome [Sphingomonas sp. BK580]MBB3695461.1 cytochrome c [Sphingomonas sp. BK580]